jgi:hypothetical protein
VRKYVHVTTMYVPRARRFERPTCPYLSVFVRCVRCARIVRPSVARVCERAPVRKEKNPTERERRENPRAEEPKPNHPQHKQNQHKPKAPAPRSRSFKNSIPSQFQEPTRSELDPSKLWLRSPSDPATPRKKSFLKC